MGTTIVHLKNTSAHLKHISLAGGELVTVPPTETGPGIEIKLESDEERVSFQKALATPAVKAWIDAGELVVDGAAAAPEHATPPVPGTPGAPGAPATPPAPTPVPGTPGAPGAPATPPAPTPVPTPEPPVFSDPPAQQPTHSSSYRDEPKSSKRDRG